jgi:hypothetical protein
MTNYSFYIGQSVSIDEHEGEWVVAEMVLESDGIVTERPFWLRPAGQSTGWIRASAAEMSPYEQENAPAVVKTRQGLKPLHFPFSTYTSVA